MFLSVSTSTRRFIVMTMERPATGAGMSPSSLEPRPSDHSNNQLLYVDTTTACTIRLHSATSNRARTSRFTPVVVVTLPFVIACRIHAHTHHRCSSDAPFLAFRYETDQVTSLADNDHRAIVFSMSARSAHQAACGRAPSAHHAQHLQRGGERSRELLETGLSRSGFRLAGLSCLAEIPQAGGVQPPTRAEARRHGVRSTDGRDGACGARVAAGRPRGARTQCPAGGKHRRRSMPR